VLAVFGVVSVVLLMTALIVTGFVANTSRFEHRMRSPGCYWTWAMAIGLLAGAVTGSSAQSMLFGFAVLAAAAILWTLDNRRREMAK
jgi:ABC-type transport system involved in multi-copper enzyme maturation permease subunit